MNEPIEIVRCKDCVYFGDMYTKEKDGTEWHFCGYAIPSGVTPDDYCSYGEKKQQAASPLKLWISVKAMLPDPYTKCIVQDKSDHIAIGVYTEFGWTFAHYMDDPVAWMPAPELFKEEGGK